jgi:hypothetical protein
METKLRIKPINAYSTFLNMADAEENGDPEKTAGASFMIVYQLKKDLRSFRKESDPVM